MSPCAGAEAPEALLPRGLCLMKGPSASAKRLRFNLGVPVSSDMASPQDEKQGCAAAPPPSSTDVSLNAPPRALGDVSASVLDGSNTRGKEGMRELTAGNGKPVLVPPKAAMVHRSVVSCAGASATS